MTQSSVFVRDREVNSRKYVDGEKQFKKLKGSRRSKIRAARHLAYMGDEAALNPLLDVWRTDDIFYARFAIEKIIERENLDLDIDYDAKKLIKRSENKKTNKSSLKSQSKKISKPVGNKTLAFILIPLIIIAIIIVVFSFSPSPDVSSNYKGYTNTSTPSYQPVAAKNLTEAEYKTEIRAIVDQQLTICDDLGKTASELSSGFISASDARTYNSGDSDAVTYVQEDLDAINPPEKYKTIHERLNTANTYLEDAVDSGDLSKVRQARNILNSVNNELNLGLGTYH